MVERNFLRIKVVGGIRDQKSNNICLVVSIGILWVKAIQDTYKLLHTVGQS